MNTENFSTLQVFQSLFRKCKRHFLQSCPKEFIRFLCECIVNLLKGNLQAIKSLHIVQCQDKVWLLSLKKQLGSKEEMFCGQKKDCNQKQSLHLPSVIICPGMEQFLLVPASVYNKSVTTQSVAKQELPMYKAEQPPTYQIDSLKRDNDERLFGKADPLIEKILSCSRIKPSNSQTRNLDGVDTGVLISDFTLHLRWKNLDVPDIYFTLHDAAGISPYQVFNQNAKVKVRRSWVPFKVRTSEAAKTVYARWCYLRFCRQLGKS